MKNILEIVCHELTQAGIDYHYIYNDSAVVKYPYVTGEYTESNYDFETNHNTGDFLLELWTRNGKDELIELNNKIKEVFRDYRKTVNGETVHISYISSYPVITNDENLDKIETHLEINYWEGE